MTSIHFRHSSLKKLLKKKKNTKVIRLATKQQVPRVAKGSKFNLISSHASSFPLWHKYKWTTSPLPELAGPLAVLFDNLTPAISPSPLDITSPSLRQMVVLCFHCRLSPMSDAACWVAESIVGKKSAPGVMESFSF